MPCQPGDEIPISLLLNWAILKVGGAVAPWPLVFAMPNAMFLAENPDKAINPIHMEVAMGLSVLAVINSIVCHSCHPPEGSLAEKRLSYFQKINGFNLEVLGAPGAMWACCFAIPNACLQRGGYHWYLTPAFLQRHTWVSVGFSMLILANAIACYFPQSLERGVGQKGSSCMQKINRVVLDVLGAPGAMWACFYAIINTFLQRLGYDWYATGDYDEGHMWAGVALCSIVLANGIYCFKWRDGEDDLDEEAGRTPRPSSDDRYFTASGGGSFSDKSTVSDGSKAGGSLQEGSDGDANSDHSVGRDSKSDNSRSVASDLDEDVTALSDLSSDDSRGCRVGSDVEEGSDETAGSSEEEGLPSDGKELHSGVDPLLQPLLDSGDDESSRSVPSTEFSR